MKLAEQRMKLINQQNQELQRKKDQQMEFYQKYLKQSAKQFA